MAIRVRIPVYELLQLGNTANLLWVGDAYNMHSIVDTLAVTDNATMTVMQRSHKEQGCNLSCFFLPRGDRMNDRTGVQIKSRPKKWLREPCTCMI